MKRRRLGGIIVIALITLLSLLLASAGTAAGSERLLSPSLEHPAGTDTMGRDLAGRVAYGVLVSFSIALPVSVISILLGIALSFAFSVSGFPTIPFLMLSDTMKSLPPVLLALFLNALSGPGMLKLIVALTVGNVPNIARLCHSRMMVLRSDGPSLAALSMGVGRIKVFMTHMLPFLLPYLGTEAVSIFSASILTEASLSYLGCGVPPMIPSLGSILAEARPVMLSAPWMIAFPAVILALIGIVLDMIISGTSETDTASH